MKKALSVVPLPNNPWRIPGASRFGGNHLCHSFGSRDARGLRTQYPRRTLVSDNRSDTSGLRVMPRPATPACGLAAAPEDATAVASVKCPSPSLPVSIHPVALLPLKHG